MNPVKLAREMDAKYRRVRRFVESDNFRLAYRKCESKKHAIILIQLGDIDALKEWAYKTNPLVDAPLRWLRDQAKIRRIKDYSRKTKVQLVEDITRID